MYPARHYRFRVLLASVAVLVVVFPFLRISAETRVLLDVLYTLVFLVALLGIFTDRRLRVVAVLLGVPTVVGVWTGYILPGVGVPRLPLSVGFHVLAALFFTFTTGVILRQLHHEKGVSLDSVYGAFCGYLLVGLVFGHLYSILELLRRGSFVGAGFINPHPDDYHFLLTYFSFLTLTTVGFGDIIPATDAARGLTVVEAVLGQFYIAVLVAELIGKRSSQPRSDTPPDAKG